MEEFIVDCRPDVIIVAAAARAISRCRSADRQAAHQANVALFLCCMCPRAGRSSKAPCGPLEPTNQWYARAKIAGVMLCQAYRAQYGRRYISAIPTNLFGPGDNFHPENSHVPAP